MHKFGIVIGSLCLFAAVQPHLPPHENALTCSLHLGVWTLTSVSQKTNNTVFTYGKIHVIVIPCVVNKNLHSLPGICAKYFATADPVVTCQHTFCIIKQLLTILHPPMKLPGVL